MQYSPHQLACFAHQLTRRAATDSMDRMAGVLPDAQVDLNSPPERCGIVRHEQSTKRTARTGGQRDKKRRGLFTWQDEIQQQISLINLFVCDWLLA